MKNLHICLFDFDPMNKEDIFSAELFLTKEGVDGENLLLELAKDGEIKDASKGVVLEVQIINRREINLKSA